jgi:hypothetical protein
MKNRSLRHLLLRLGLLCLALGLPLATHAQRRDFAASYQLTHIVESPNTGSDQVAVTITLKLFNYSGAEIRTGAVVLYSSQSHPMPGLERNPAVDNILGAFPLIASLPAYKETTLRHRFTIPAAEYALWKQGREPELVFLKPDAEGNAQNTHIDLRREMPSAATQNDAEVVK